MEKGKAIEIKPIDFMTWETIKSFDIDDMGILYAIRKYPNIINSPDFNWQALKEYNLDQKAFNESPFHKKIRHLKASRLIKYKEAGGGFILTWRGRFYMLYRNRGAQFWLLVGTLILSSGVIRFKCDGKEKNLSTQPTEIKLKSTSDSIPYRQKNAASKKIMTPHLLLALWNYYQFEDVRAFLQNALPIQKKKYIKKS